MAADAVVTQDLDSYVHAQRQEAAIAALERALALAVAQNRRKPSGYRETIRGVIAEVREDRPGSLLRKDSCTDGHQEGCTHFDRMPLKGERVRVLPDAVAVVRDARGFPIGTGTPQWVRPGDQCVVMYAAGSYVSVSVRGRAEDLTVESVERV